VVPGTFFILTIMLEPGLQLNELDVKTVMKYASEITQVLNKAADTVLIRLFNLRDL
jgi:hypothetical protein